MIVETICRNGCNLVRATLLSRFDEATIDVRGYAGQNTRNGHRSLRGFTEASVFRSSLSFSIARRSRVVRLTLADVSRERRVPCQLSSRGHSQREYSVSLAVCDKPAKAFKRAGVPRCAAKFVRIRAIDSIRQIARE